jgi:MFS transporter, DHA1 family, tetracycline resistance protein
MTAVSYVPRPRAAALFVVVVVALDMLALGIVIPVLPRLVLGFSGDDTARATAIYGGFGVIFAAMQFVCSPILGALSDRFGRRPVILLSVFGLGLDYVLMALAPSVAWLFVGRVIAGDTAASVGTAGAYIADVTPPAERAKAFGMMGAAFGVGFVLGPALGGLLGGQDPRLPFWVAAVFTLLNGVYGAFVLPESLPPERRAPFRWRRANPVAGLAFLRAQPRLLDLAAVSFLGSLAHTVLPSTFVLYADYRYGWGEREVGLTLAGVGVCSVLVQGALVGPVVARLGERRTLLLGQILGAIGFAVYAFAGTGPLFWLGVPIMGLWGLSGPALQALMTRRVGSDEQGRLQGAISSLNGIAAMLGPAVFAAAFARSIAPHLAAPIPGAAFLLAAAVLMGAMLLAVSATRAA